MVARSYTWLHGLLCGAAIAIAPASGLLCIGLITPAATSLWLDTSVGKPVARATLLIAGATAIMPLARLWNGDNSVSAAIGLLSDPMTLALSWVSAGLGWVIAEATTLVSYTIRKTIIQRREVALTAERAVLNSEWQARG